MYSDSDLKLNNKKKNTGVMMSGRSLTFVKDSFFSFAIFGVNVA